MYMYKIEYRFENGKTILFVGQSKDKNIAESRAFRKLNRRLESKNEEFSDDNIVGDYLEVKDNKVV